MTAYPDLSEIKTKMVPTRQAAFYLGRAPDTLRVYARSPNPPIAPSRFGGRYQWPVAEIKKIVGVAE